MTTKHVLGFSGGIDSQACAGWLLDRFAKEDVVLINSQAGRNEHPITVDFVAAYSATVHPVIEVIPLVKDLLGRGTREGTGAKERRDALGGDDEELTFPGLAFVKGRFPSRKAQFCTQHLKLEPLLRFVNEHYLSQGIDIIRYAGVRADESQARKDLPERQWDDYFDCELVRPLLRWTKKECFDFVVARGEEYNPLYKMGFGRVGCAPCINAGKDDIRLWACRFPAMIDKVRAWEKEVGRTFFPPCVPGMRINFIDEVVQWSKTTHGGKQMALPFVEAEAEAHSCSSKYGLCE